MEKQIPTNLMVIYFSIYLGMTIELKRRRNPFDGTWAKHMFGL